MDMEPKASKSLYLTMTSVAVVKVGAALVCNSINENYDDDDP